MKRWRRTKLFFSFFQFDNMFLGRIYKIVHHESPEDAIYVGSTIKKLWRRFAQHKHACLYMRETQHYPHYVHMRAHGGPMNFRIVLLEEGMFETKNEMRALEEQYRLELRPMNKYRAYLSREMKAYRMKVNSNRWKNKPWTCEYCGNTIKTQCRWLHKRGKKHTSRFLASFVKAARGRFSLLRNINNNNGQPVVNAREGFLRETQRKDELCSGIEGS